MKLITPRLNSIGELIEIAIGALLYHSSTDFKEPKSLNHLKEEDFYSSNLYDGSRDKEMKQFISEVELIKKEIDALFAIPSITSIDDDLIDVLARLRDSKFQDIYSSYNVPKNPFKPIEARSLKMELLKYYILYKRLCLYSTPVEYQVIG
jgi:hypothetical protein